MLYKAIILRPSKPPESFNMKPLTIFVECNSLKEAVAKIERFEGSGVNFRSIEHVEGVLWK